MWVEDSSTHHVRTWLKGLSTSTWANESEAAISIDNTTNGTPRPSVARMRVAVCGHLLRTLMDRSQARATFAVVTAIGKGQDLEQDCSRLHEHDLTDDDRQKQQRGLELSHVESVAKACVCLWNEVGNASRRDESMTLDVSQDDAVCTAAVARDTITDLVARMCDMLDVDHTDEMTKVVDGALKRQQATTISTPSGSAGDSSNQSSQGPPSLVRWDETHAKSYPKYNKAVANLITQIMNQAWGPGGRLS